MKEVAVDGSRGERIPQGEGGLGVRSPRIAKAKEGLVEMQAALDQAERVVGAAARRRR